MSEEFGKERFRIAAMIDLFWNFKRHTDLFAGIVRYTQEHADLRCVVDDFADRTLAQQSRKQRIYDAVIGRVTPELAAQAGRRKLPLVNVWLSSPVKNLISVLPDENRAGQLLAEHLIHRGIRRFLCLTRRGDLGERQLASRVVTTVTAEGCTCDTIRVPLLFAHTHAQWIKTRAQIEEWLGRTPMPVGIVVGVDIMARHGAQISHGLGLRVPQDVAVAGGYNEPTICLYPEPSITSIEYGYDHVGYEAARLVHQMLLGGQVEQRSYLIPPRELVVRQSSDFIYVDEPIVSAAMRFIAQNVRHSIGVQDVALAAGASRRTLEQRFQAHLHRSVGAEIRRVRIEHAKRLITGSKLTFSQIANLVGFATPQYMARVFQQEVGLAPREYRRQRMGNR